VAGGGCRAMICWSRAIWWRAMICWSQNSFSELWAEILDPKRWAIYQTEAIENWYSVWKFQDFSEQIHILKIQKQLPFGQKMANYLELFLQFLNISLLAKVLKFLRQIAFFSSFSFIYSTTLSVEYLLIITQKNENPLASIPPIQWVDQVPSLTCRR
jgi:hypothetical protein